MRHRHHGAPGQSPFSHFQTSVWGWLGEFISAGSTTIEPTLDNSKLIESEIPNPQPGQMLLQAIYLSRGPYMRGRNGRLAGAREVAVMVIAMAKNIVVPRPIFFRWRWSKP
jgi:hypothetical protein